MLLEVGDCVCWTVLLEFDWNSCLLWTLEYAPSCFLIVFSNFSGSKISCINLSWLYIFPHVWFIIFTISNRAVWSTLHDAWLVEDSSESLPVSPVWPGDVSIISECEQSEDSGRGIADASRVCVCDSWWRQIYLLEIPLRFAWGADFLIQNGNGFLQNLCNQPRVVPHK